MQKKKPRGVYIDRDKRVANSRGPWTWTKSSKMAERKAGAERDRWPIEPGIEHNRMSQRAIPTSVAIIENRIGLGESASAERARSTRDLNEIGGGGRRMKKKKKRGERFF